MEAKICDKCGKFFTYSASRRIIGFKFALRLSLFSDNNEYIESDKYDLCPDCVDELKKWIKNEEDKESNNDE